MAANLGPPPPLHGPLFHTKVALPATLVAFSSQQGGLLLSSALIPCTALSSEPPPHGVTPLLPSSASFFAVPWPPSCSPSLAVTIGPHSAGGLFLPCIDQ
ncbi:hypothetical protein GOP47_0006792 [Adiantum capillus-veneris]|uniref:Uncharacterized protein n=1 Tax=Adiantum capillus-veneris TaxID=13818 RepID=A0A9D4ZMU1_ADICA|nr:hypothetical protein GOP47_0006792 [Adiantum capillus-veneris]